MRRRGAAVPCVGDGDEAILGGFEQAQHRHAWQAAALVEAAAGALVEQAFVLHVLQERLQQDLFRPVDAEGAGDFSLADGALLALDPIENSLPARKISGFFGFAAGHAPEHGGSRAGVQQARAGIWPGAGWEKRGAGLKTGLSPRRRRVLHPSSRQAT